MTASGGDGGVKYCVCAHMCAFYLPVLSAEWHAGATLGRVGLCCVSALCQARWLLSLRQEVEQWEEKCKDGRPEQRQSGLSPEPPHLETTCSWLTPLPLSSSLSLMLIFSFSRWRRIVSTGWDLCLIFKYVFAVY